jgi:Uma2 family endonuclease
MTMSARPPVTRGLPGKFHNAAEWLHELGDVPVERIIMDPWPGTATEADLLHYVEHDTPCELIDGTLVEKPVGWWESLLAVRLAAALAAFVDPRGLGMITGGDGPLRMRSKRVRLPDVTYISASALPSSGLIPQESIGSLPPTIAAEVISKTNTAREMRQKLREYFDSGAKLVWMVYPVSKTVAVYEGPTDEPFLVLAESDTLTGGQVLPGFSIKLSVLFAPSLSQEIQSNG